MKKFLFMVLMLASFVSFASTSTVLDKDDMIIVVDDVGDISMDIVGLVATTQGVDNGSLTSSVNVDTMVVAKTLLGAIIFLADSYEPLVYCPDSYDLYTNTGNVKATIYRNIKKTILNSSSGGLAKLC